MGRAFVLALGVLLAGCHRYVPARPGAVPVGAEIRVHLTEDGARRIEALYAAQAGPVSGELESWSNEVVVIAVPVPAAPGMMDRGLRNRVIIPVADVLSVEVQERDRTRTMILSAGVATVVLGTAIAAFSGVFGGSRPPDTPAEEDAIIPLWLRVFQ